MQQYILATLAQLDLLVKPVIFFKCKIKETVELLAKVVRLVRQEPLVSLEKQVQQETMVILH